MNTVAAGATKVVSITLSAPSLPGPYTDTASTTSSTDDPNLANNTSSVTFSVQQREADLSIVVSASTPTVLTGDNETYTISVSNLGPQDALGVSWHDVTPAGFAVVSFTFVSGAQAGDSITNNGSGTLDGNMNTVAAGATKEVSIQPDAAHAPRP